MDESEILILPSNSDNITEDKIYNHLSGITDNE